MSNFAPADFKLFSEKGIDIQQINKQIEAFKKGFPFVNIVAPAIVKHGMICFDDVAVNDLIEHFEQRREDYNILKFVPASGAASRMFKHLYEFLQSYKGTEEEKNQLENDENTNSVGYFLQHLKQFAFYYDLEIKAKSKGENLNQLIEQKKYDKIVQLLIDESGLDYGALPKALLRFHSYKNENRFAIEEHLVEAAQYCTNEDKIAKIHFTISNEHKTKFEKVLLEVTPKYEKLFGIKYEIQFSEQKSSTDTIAVDLDNLPFRNDDESLLFRPGGHGALIENLNELEDDIIFIKNIDNIVPDHLREETYRYKKAIGGLLLKLQEKTFDYLDILDSGFLEDGELLEIKQFASEQLMIDIPAAFEGYSEIEKIDFLFNQLNRPMRVCGMVKNEGEPGGGPYWIKNEAGVVSLQIVESSQMDLKDPQQLAFVSQSTHFNPVDLVCSVYNFMGNKFDLKDFIDPATGFISIKSKDGRDLKALELPGLWNGAMADWITVFVETPIITFNPVKTVNDLLRPQHQPAK